MAGVVVVVAACVAAAAPASGYYDFRSFKGNLCRLTTANSQSGARNAKTIHFASSVVCTKQMDEIALDSKLTNGSATWSGGGGACLYPSCGTTPISGSRTLSGMKSGAYLHKTDLILYLTYGSGDFWIEADERAACTYTGIAVTSLSIHCTLYEPIAAEP